MKKSALPPAVFSAILLVMLASPFAARVHAANATWAVKLVASNGTYSSTTVLGVADDATEGFDPTYDSLTPPQPTTGVYSYFWYPNNPHNSVDYRKLSTSIIPPSANMNWNLSVEPIGISDPITLSWNSTPSGYKAYIINFSDNSVLADMTNTLGNQYSFHAADSVIITFTVNIAVPELPTGPILVLAACFTSYEVFRFTKRRQRGNQNL
jgi:hypothetical protein